MRRAVFAVTGLAAGTTLLVVLKAGPSPTPVAQQQPGGVLPSVGAAPTDPPRGTAVPGDAPAATRRPGARQTAAPPPAKPPSTRPPAPTAVTVTGPVVTNDFGRVQVRVTMLGSRITNVTAVELPRETAQSARRSEAVDERYSGTAGEAVRRQSGDLDTVSGATATSDSYRRSLAAAIDAARGQRG